MQIRAALPTDAPAIAAIYNEGIADRVATFETRLRTADEVTTWCDGQQPIVVAETDGAVIACAATFAYRPRKCYRGIAEFSVYSARAWRDVVIVERLLRENQP